MFKVQPNFLKCSEHLLWWRLEPGDDVNTEGHVKQNLIEEKKKKSQKLKDIRRDKTLLRALCIRCEDEFFYTHFFLLTTAVTLC